MDIKKIKNKAFDIVWDKVEAAFPAYLSKKVMKMEDLVKRKHLLQLFFNADFMRNTKAIEEMKTLYAEYIATISKEKIQRLVDLEVQRLIKLEETFKSLCLN